MDPGSYGQGAGYQAGLPVYYNQPGFVHQPVYQSYHQHSSQAPVYFASHSLPVTDSFYPGSQHVPPSQPTIGHTAAHSRGIPFYQHIQNVPPPAQGQPLSYTAPPPQQGQSLSYTAPPPQQFAVPAHNSSLLYASSASPPPAIRPLTPTPPPAPTPPQRAATPPAAPPTVKKTEDAASMISWSAAVSPPSPVGYNFTSRSTTPPGISSGTCIPPRLKLLAEQFEHYKHSQTSFTAASSHTPSSFLQAASQHGIVVERPVTPVSSTSPSATPPTTCSSDSAPIIPAAGKGFDEMKNDNGGVIDRQDLVDYYVNKHESLGYHKVVEKDLKDCNRNFTNTNVDSEINSKYNNVNNNADPFVNGDKNSNVINWLSKSEDGEVVDYGIDYMKVDDKYVQAEVAENGSQLDVQEELEDALCKNEDLMKQNNDTKMNCSGTDDAGNVMTDMFEDSVEIVIEEHEFLSNNLQSSVFEESSTSSYDEDDAYDEIDGEVNINYVDIVKKGVPITVCAENDHTRQICDVQVCSVEQPFEISVAADAFMSKQEVRFSLTQTCDEEIVKRYRQQLKEAENIQIELLTTTNEFAEQVASKIVKEAVARGVLKFFKEFSGDNAEAIEMDNCEPEKKETFPERMTGLYTWTREGSAISSGETSEIVQEKGQAEEIRTDRGVEDVLEIKVQPTLKQTDDFEKFFFKQTAFRHGITISSPSKPNMCQTLNNQKDNDIDNYDNLETSESQNHTNPNNFIYKYPGNMSDQYRPQNFHQLNKNQKEVCRYGIKKPTEDFDSDITSVEGSQSDSGEAFRIKASQRGILVQDPRDRVELSTDSDAELEQLSLRRNSRKESVDQEIRRSTSTPDPCEFSLNPESPVFKPGWKKRTISGGLRPDAAEFNPESLNSSFSLNTSVSESDASEKLDSSMRVNAPEFVPTSSKTSSHLKPDAASFEPKSNKQTKQNIVLNISTLKEKKPNPSVAIQACPDTSTTCVGTRRIKTKESCTETGSCDTRDVSVNTEANVDIEIEGKNVTVKRKAVRLTNKASNTDMTQKRSVGINVRLRNPVKPSTCSVMTMTDTVPSEEEKYTNSGLTDTSDRDLMERLKKQDILLESMGKLQIELMLFKEKEIKEKLCNMKEDLKKRMTGVIGLFTDGVEVDVLQNMIQSKLSVLEEALAQVKSVTSTTISQIQSGKVLEQLPDFSSVLPQISKSPVQHFTSPEKQSADHMSGTSPELSTSILQSSGLGPKQRTSPVRFPENSPMLDVSLQNTPSTSLAPQSKTKQKTSPETSSNIPGFHSGLPKVPHSDQSTSEHNLPQSSPAGKLPVSTTEGKLKFPDIKMGSLSLNISDDVRSRLDNRVSKRKSPTHVVSVQRTRVTTSDKVSGENVPNRIQEDKIIYRDTTIAESVKELDDLKVEGTVLCGSKKKVHRTKGFMEMEDSSDEEDVEDNSALVIDKLDDESEETKQVERAAEQETEVTATAQQTIEMKPVTKTFKEDLKAENALRLDSLEDAIEGTVTNDREKCSEVIPNPTSDSEGKQIDGADTHGKDYKKETGKSNHKGSLKPDTSGYVNKETDYDIANKGKSEIDRNHVVFSEDGAIDKLISEKMFAEYGKETGDTSSSSNMNVSDDGVGNVSDRINGDLDNTLDAIDSDENETVRICEFVNRNSAKKSEGIKIDSVELAVKKPDRDGDATAAKLKRTTERLKETVSDDDYDTDKALERPTAGAPGMFGPELNIDPKEVFMSPQKSVMLDQFKDSNVETAKSAIAELPANQGALVGPSLGGIGNMPVMLGNMDPILYQAVLAQLIQAYPELASNQELLTQVAVQQTNLLQMYVSNQSGSGQKMGGLGIESGEMQGVVGNTCMGMTGFGQQQLLGPDAGLDSNKSVSVESLEMPNVPSNVAALNDSSVLAPGSTSPLGSGCQDEAPAAKQLNKSIKPPGLYPLSDFSALETDDEVNSCSRKYAAFDNSHSSIELESEVNEKETVKEKETVSLVNDVKVRLDNIQSSKNEVKPSKSSVGLDDFDLPPVYGARPKSFNKNNNAVNEQAISSTDKQSSMMPDFLPDFAKRHKPENNSTRVVHHFVKNVSDTVSRAIACSDQVNFERRSQSPIPTPEKVWDKAGKSDFPPLQKTSRSWVELAQMGNVSNVVMSRKPAARTSSGKMQSSTKTENSLYTPNLPRNLPPRLRRQSCPGNQHAVTTGNQEIQPFKLQQQESWDDEVNDHAQTFTLLHDVHKPITVASDVHKPITVVSEKNQKADLTNPFIAPVSKDVPKIKSSTSMTGLCDITLPKSAEKTEDEKQMEEWQEVQGKRKRHCSKEQKKELRQFSAPYLNSSPVTNAKQNKKNNFERLVGRMQQEFPQANKQEVIDAIQKIREERGTLSGLSMETIIEKGHSFIKPAKKKIPGLWADKKQPVQTLNISSRIQPASKSSDTCINTFEEDICVICHDPLSTEHVKELDCMHVFHSQCISQWVERERTCPTCRKHALFPEEFPRLGK